MRNITTPAKAVSFEDALRNLAAKLTGKPAASLPRTQEAVVQYIADNISSVKELTDALAKELAIRLTPGACGGHCPGSHGAPGPCGHRGGPGQPGG